MRPLVAYVALYQGIVKRLEVPPVGFGSSWNAKSGAVPIRLTVSLATLEPGEYDCQVTVLDPGSARAAFWRVPIVVIR
jgi:hypothetical protein